MKNVIRNILLVVIAAVMLMSFAGCKEEGAAAPADALQVTTLRVLPSAYQFEEFDLRDIIVMEEGVSYSATACYVEQKFDETNSTFVMQEHAMEVVDLRFTPETLNDTEVTITAKRGKETASKRVSIATIIRAEPLDDLYKASGILGFADTGITKSVNTNEQYIYGENSTTSLQVKFSGKDAHDWGNIFMELSHPSAQNYFTDKIWDNAIVTFWVYNPMEQDIEFQLTVNDHTFPVMLDWTGEEGNFRRQYAKAGEWTQIFFSLRRMGTTHKLVTDMYSTESLTIKFQYKGYSTTQAYELEFYLDNLDVVPASMYPDVDTTYIQTNETLEQGWENMPQDTGWQGANTIYVYDEMIGDDSTCSLYATFDSAEGISSPFVVLNPEAMLGSSQMSGLPDMTGGTLSAYFKFEKAVADVKVDLVKVVGSEWQFSNMLPMQLTPVGGGWYKGTLDVNQFDFTTNRNDDILRIRFTFSGISKSSKVWIDTVKFDYQYAVKVKESMDKDWINLPGDSGMTTVTVTKYSTSYKKAEGSVRSMQITAPSNEAGVMTWSPQYAVLEGKMSSVPNMKNGVVKAYFYFGDKTPSAALRLYNSSWKYCNDVDFIFEDLGEGWYLGTIPTGLFQGYTEGDSGEIIRISMMIPAGYTVYVDGLMHYPNEEYATTLNPDDVFGSGIFTAVGFTGNSGAEVSETITNESAEAIHMWADEVIGWPEAGVRFALPVDMSAYEQIAVDVKTENAHSWVAMKIYYLDANGIEKCAELGADLTTEQWQTVSFKLSNFAGADLTKVTGVMLLANFGDSFKPAATNHVWLDNLKLGADTGTDEPAGLAFEAGVGTIVEIPAADYATISFDYQLTGNGTMAVILRSPSWLEYYGDYNFDANGLVGQASGVHCEALDNGYIRVTMTMAELNRTGCADNRENAPATIALFDIYGPMTTAGGYVDNIQTTLNDQPEGPVEVIRGEEFQAGVTKNILLNGEAATSISFEYKLTNPGQIHVILRAPDWIKYYGDFAFNAEGEADDYMGITTEKLDDGYIRVTVIFSQLERSGCVNNLNNAPSSVGVMDIYEWGTASGYVDNIQLDVQVEQAPDVPDVPENPEIPDETEKAFDPENIFASGEIVADGFVGDCGYEVTTDAIHAWTNTKIGWPTVGVSFASTVDISAYEDITLDVKVSNTHKWISIKIGYLNGNGVEVFSEVGADFLQNDWQTVTMKLSQFNGADLTKVTKILVCMNLETNVSAGVCNEVWLDNLKVTKEETESEETGGMELSFQAYTNAFLTFEERAFKTVQFDYKLEAAGEMYIILRDGSWLKYFGDYAFNADGEVVDYSGITTEKLNSGYIRVTMILDELDRTGCNNNRDIAPETLAVFDVYGSTTVNGHIKNLQFLNNVPAKMAQKKVLDFLFWKPEWEQLLQQEVDAE